jgi:hypothetical protein
MERIRTFNMTADMASLQNALTTGEVPASLGDPMQALVQRVSEAAVDSPVTIYLCSPGEHAGLRDHFAYLLARTLTQQIPSTLLVDCDFLDVGLHGLVPEADALGFLDLLLYGSSLGVITQVAGGEVKVIGAGSFPVTKRMPFVLGAFEEASRRLVNHARCVVFVGPLHQDDGELHPLIGATNLPMLVRESTATRADAIDPVEERIASTWDVELTSVRLVSPSASIPVDKTFERVLGDEEDVVEEPAPPPPPPAERHQPSLSELADDAGDELEDHPPRREPPQVPFPTTPDEPGARPRRVNSLAVVVAIIAIAVAAWWVWRDRGGTVAPIATDRFQAATTGSETSPAAADTTPRAERPDTAAEAAVDTVGSEPQRLVEEVVEEPVFVDPADTGGRSGGTVLLNSHDIHVMEDLKRDWADHYFIHISSFRRSVEARDEVAFLESREFPVFIVFLDLDAKGKWYRVYAGPFATRDEAREVKKSLDDIARVRFTRITKISG